MSSLKVQLTRDIVRYLLEERAAATSDDARDALGVAAECVSAALLCDASSPPPQLLPGDPSLMHLYCLGLANYDQIARAIATHRGADVTPAVATTTPAVAEVPRQQHSVESVRHVPIDAAFDDIALEERFQAYAKLLEQQGYFKGTTRDSAAYVDRVAKAREKFRSRFAAGVTPNATVKPTPAANVVPSTPSTAAAAAAVPSSDAVARAEQFKASGNTLLQARKYEEALRDYDQAIALNANVAIYHANKAAALSFLNRHADAVDAAERAILVDPGYTKAYSRLGLSLLALNRTREALAAYEEAARREPDNAQYVGAVQSTRAKLQASEAVVAEPGDGDDDDDDGGELVGDRDGGGAGGMPDLASLMGNPMLAQMMANPQMRAMAQQMMSDPNAMANLMNNPMLQGLMGGGAGGGAGRGKR
jgi:tetratricopeptide (TPR) repeat protein